ncbi:MAG: selenobiotic family peptide radical SAM maturase [Syntrophaceae bacterium]|nr:selenobiotic family peptide radical SAM maturase [Syntrophaceae bacterium]
MDKASPQKTIDFHVCRKWLDPDIWLQIVSECGSDDKPDRFVERIRFYGSRSGAPAYLSELFCLEWHIQKVSNNRTKIQSDPDETTLNPSLCMVELNWKNLPGHLLHDETQKPEPGTQLVMIWQHPKDGKVLFTPATAEDLLVLKMISEQIDQREVARQGTLPVSAIDAAIERATAKGIILAPPSKIRRDIQGKQGVSCFDEPFLASPSFTLQWHVTQACELHCRHCYDRSDRSPLSLEQALGILDGMEHFCVRKHVRGQISFSGGNPLLHPDFKAIYRAAADRGFSLAILGNPTSRNLLEELVAIQVPNFFQVSLEGLPEYNDYMRGEGHFDRSLAFLDLLKELKIYSMVMLTLTKENIQQVIPLGNLLRGKTNAFFFNRLSLVGEGASLALPTKQEYIDFLKAYQKAARENPILGLKDNLFNILRHEQGKEPFGGCTGFGCGAAFNFLAVLPDGEVHACRKFPSAIGNIYSRSLEEIYDSALAERYRKGCSICIPCKLKPVCGGCLASAYSHGLNIFEQKDPFCFLTEEPR